MAIGNMASTLSLLEGYLASEFLSSTYNRNQGSALLIDFVRQIASRADLSYNYLRVTYPLLNTSADVDVESGAGGLIAIVVGTNATAAGDEIVLVYETNTVVEGTTRHIAAMHVDGGGSTATGKMGYAVYPQPIPFAALSWSSILNAADGDGEGSVLTAAGGTKVMLVYAE